VTVLKYFSIGSDYKDILEEIGDHVAIDTDYCFKKTSSDHEVTTLD
jgi:hypothetical protein